MYEIGQVIFIVTKKDDIIIVPVRITSTATTKELDDQGNVLTRVSYKVVSGTKTYDLDEIKGSQFSSVDEAVNSLKIMWDKKLTTMRSRALTVAKQTFGYDYDAQEVNSNVEFNSDVSTQQVPSSITAVPTTAKLSIPLVIDDEPGMPRMRIDISSIDAAFEKQI